MNIFFPARLNYNTPECKTMGMEQYTKILCGVTLTTAINATLRYSYILVCFSPKYMINITETHQMCGYAIVAQNIRGISLTNCLARPKFSPFSFIFITNNIVKYFLIFQFIIFYIIFIPSLFSYISGVYFLYMLLCPILLLLGVLLCLCDDIILFVIVTTYVTCVLF